MKSTCAPGVAAEVIAVRPGPPLTGAVTVDGSKNAGLPLLAAAPTLGRPLTSSGLVSAASTSPGAMPKGPPFAVWPFGVRSCVASTGDSRCTVRAARREAQRRGGGYSAVPVGTAELNVKWGRS